MQLHAVLEGHCADQCGQRRFSIALSLRDQKQQHQIFSSALLLSTWSSTSQREDPKEPLHSFIYFTDLHQQPARCPCGDSQHCTPTAHPLHPLRFTALTARFSSRYRRLRSGE